MQGFRKAAQIPISPQASWERCQAQALSPDPAKSPPQAALVGITRATRGVMGGEHHHAEGQGDAPRPQVGDGGGLVGGAAGGVREGGQQVLHTPGVAQQGAVVRAEGCRTRSAISSNDVGMWKHMALFTTPTALLCLLCKLLLFWAEHSCRPWQQGAALTSTTATDAGGRSRP